MCDTLAVNWFQRFVEGEQPVVTPHMEEICDHYQRYLGGEFRVFHEEVSHLVHVDVLRFPATASRPFQVLCSVGMSGRSVSLAQPPAGRYEVVLCLPHDWEAEGDLETETWPIEVIRYFTRVVLQQNVPLRPFLSSPFGGPEPTTVGRTPFLGAMTFPLDLLFSDRLSRIRLSDQVVDLFGLMLLTKPELDYKLQFTDGATFWQFLSSQGRPVIETILADPNRASFV